jgi:hypothetical protein
MEVAVPILGSVPCDKAAYHKGLVTLEQKLAVLDGHLRTHTFLVRTCSADEHMLVTRATICGSACSMCQGEQLS